MSPHRQRAYALCRSLLPGGSRYDNRQADHKATLTGAQHTAHGIHIGPDEQLYCTDDGDHTARKCTLEGKVLLTIGIPGKPAPYMSGEPFNRCTHTALSPRGGGCAEHVQPSGSARQRRH